MTAVYVSMSEAEMADRTLPGASLRWRLDRAEVGIYAHADIRSGKLSDKASSGIIRACSVKIANERLRMQFHLARKEKPESPYMEEPKKLRRVG